MHAEHVASDHKGHCHGGAFCAGPALIPLTVPQLGLIARGEKLGMFNGTSGLAVVSNFDPPPPRPLI